jgi:hypothetical protein
VRNSDFTANLDVSYCVLENICATAHSVAVGASRTFGLGMFSSFWSAGPGEAGPLVGAGRLLLHIHTETELSQGCILSKLLCPAF